MHMVKIASYKLICFQMELWWRFRIVTALGPVVQMPVSARPGLNFNLGFFFFLSTALSWIIFYILFRVPNHQIVGKEKKTEFVFLSSNIWVQISHLPWVILNQLQTTKPWRHSEELLGKEYFQHAKKVTSDSPGLVDFAVGLVNSVFNLPDGQVMFHEQFE